MYFGLMKRLSASKLREDIYRILDHVKETGEPVEIDRKGSILKIVNTQPVSKLSRLTKRKILKVPPEKLVHINWEKEWKP